MPIVYDCIVVGSGPSGVQAAQTLVEGGMHVAMLDVGVHQEKYYQNQSLTADFSQLRKSDGNQHQYFLGKDLQSVHKDWEGTKDRLTPPLAFTKALVADWQTQTRHTKPQAFIESLARGGLGNAWGRGAFTFSPDELQRLGAPLEGWSSHYEKIATRIGISGTKGLGVQLDGLMPPLLLDKNMRGIWQRYKRRLAKGKNKEIFVERTPLAVQNQPHHNRPTEQYYDMDFWSLQKSAGYYPGHTLKTLQSSSNFHYLPQHYVYKFQEINGEVEVMVKQITSKKNKSFRCRRLLLCASVLGTARIVLNSLSEAPRKTPIVCNPFSYGAWLNMHMFGQQNSLKKSSFSQLSVYQKASSASSFNLLNLYTYRSLLLTKLIKELPFSFRFSYQLSAIIKEMLVVGGLHLPETTREENYIQLLPSQKSPIGKDLDIHYQHNTQELKAVFRQICKAMLPWGLIPILRQETASGSSKHYAGTLPFAEWPKAFQLAASGRLHFTQNIYIGDASSFRFLPAKGPTLTIMANAHRIALEILKSRKIDFGRPLQKEG